MEFDDSKCVAIAPDEVLGVEAYLLVYCAVEEQEKIVDEKTGEEKENKKIVYRKGLIVSCFSIKFFSYFCKADVARSDHVVPLS